MEVIIDQEHWLKHVQRSKRQVFLSLSLTRYRSTPDELGPTISLSLERELIPPSKEEKTNE